MGRYHDTTLESGVRYNSRTDGTRLAIGDFVAMSRCVLDDKRSGQSHSAILNTFNGYMK